MQRGEELATCSIATGIGKVFLAALEAGRLDTLPPTANAPDLIARYATHLGLDGRRYADAMGVSDPDDPDADTQPIPIVRGPARRDTTLAWVAGGAAIGIGGLILLGGGLGSDTARPRTTSTPSVAPSGTARQPTAPTTTPRSQTPPPAPVLRPTPPRAEAIELRLDARAGKTVWVEVRRGDVQGDQLFAGIVGGGVTRVIRSATPLWLGVAWAPNVAVTLNGEALDTEGGTESYRVTARGLATLGNP